MHILGIDLAKHTFDVTLLRDGGDRRHKQFANTPAGSVAQLFCFRL